MLRIRSLEECLHFRHEGLKLNSQHPHKKVTVSLCFSNPKVVWVDKGHCLALLGGQPSQKRIESRFSIWSCLKVRKQNVIARSPMFSFTMCTFRHMSIPYILNIHTHKHTKIMQVYDHRHIRTHTYMLKFVLYLHLLTLIFL